MYSRILVPLENSPYDDAILAHVARLAHASGASILLIHVADGFAARNMQQLELRESEELRGDRAYLKRMTTFLETAGFKVDSILAGGDPATEIIAAAVREHCDLIAMSTHGHRFLKDLLFGSVAESVRHRCTIPVLLVRGSRDSHEILGRQVNALPRASGAYTAPVEDYLKAIYELERAGDAAGTNEIAQRLAIAPASVSGMIRRLAKQRLLTHERYRGVRLTAAGRRVALRTIRRHRVIEAYLTRALGFSWDRVHDEAERLEHAASDELVDRMASAIGEPATDPHGAPIPTREGKIVERPMLALDALAPRERGRIVEVSDEDAARLRYLGSLGLTPGARVQLLERAPYGGPLRLRVGAKEQVIGAELAGTVLVERAD